TISGSSTPQSALIGIAVTPDLKIIFDTTKSTRKYSNLIVKPQCSLVIGWEAEQTVQYEGRAEEIQPPDLARYQEIYFRAWPNGPSRLNWPDIVYFVVTPSWIRYSDFAQDPPLIEELRLSVLS
ncbi:MAG TPA: pyridoxamine 5'-phosphate oxidase family protein, partial [Bryobacteraceae bacterium]|nr:pyridoxamine 5'-phosphate oxidase family protein [Bryobacteraceae bacterium]